MPEYECNTFDPHCLKDRPIQIDHLHIELPFVFIKRMILGEIDTSLVKRGTVNVELLEHYAFHTSTKRHISVKNSLKVRQLFSQSGFNCFSLSRNLLCHFFQLSVKKTDRRTIELLLVKPIEPPADIFVSVRLSEMVGERSKVQSITRFYLYATENNGLNSTSIGSTIGEWRTRK